MTFERKRNKSINSIPNGVGVGSKRERRNGKHIHTIMWKNKHMKKYVFNKRHSELRV